MTNVGLAILLIIVPPAVAVMVFAFCDYIKSTPVASYNEIGQGEEVKRGDKRFSSPIQIHQNDTIST